MAKKVTKKTVKKVKEKELTPFEKMMKKYKVETVTTEKQVDRIPYKIPYRNIALQKATGGVIGGSIIEIVSPSGVGKSFLGYELAGECQKMGGDALLIDSEWAFEEAYSKMTGIDLKSGTFHYTRERTLETIGPISKEFIVGVRSTKKKTPIVIILDSYALIDVQKAIDNFEANKKEQGYEQMIKPRLFYKYLKDLLPYIGKHDATLVILNQTRVDHNVLFGDKTSSLAKEIKFYVSQKLIGKAVKEIKEEIGSGDSKEKITVGMISQWVVDKNRFVIPKQRVQTSILYKNGLDKYSGLLGLLVRDQLVKMGKTSLKKDGTKIPNGAKVSIANVINPKEGLPTGYRMGDVLDMLEDYPEFLEPKWTGSMMDEETATLDEKDLEKEEGEKWI